MLIKIFVLTGTGQVKPILHFRGMTIANLKDFYQKTGFITISFVRHPFERYYFYEKTVNSDCTDALILIA